MPGRTLLQLHIHAHCWGLRLEPTLGWEADLCGFWMPSSLHSGVNTVNPKKTTDKDTGNTLSAHLTS